MAMDGTNEICTPRELKGFSKDNDVNMRTENSMEIDGEKMSLTYR